MTKKKDGLFYVIEADGFVSSNDKGEPEHFTSHAAARNRAEAVAMSNPGTIIVIASSVEIAQAPVGPVTIKETSK
jgi:hypothetical protein